MNKSLRFVGLVAALGCAVWLGGTPRAEAIASCDELRGRYCTPNFSTRTCATSTGGTGICGCEANRWDC